MKTLLMTLLLLFSTSAIALDNCYTGSWYEPEVNDGRGLVLEVTDSYAGGYYFTWDKNSNRTMYPIVGPNVTADLVEFDGFHSSKVSERLAGSAMIRVIPGTTDSFIFDYNWDYDFTDYTGSGIPWCFFDCSRSVTLVRLTQPIPCTD